MLEASNMAIASGMSLVLTSLEIINETKGNATITGSIVRADAEDVDIASKNDTLINSSQDKLNKSTKSKTWENTVTLVSSAGSGLALTIDNAVNAASLVIGAFMSRSSSDTTSVTNNNSVITAENGAVNIDATRNTKLIGANVFLSLILVP